MKPLIRWSPRKNAWQCGRWEWLECERYARFVTGYGLTPVMAFAAWRDEVNW